MSATTPQITEVIALYDSYLLTINIFLIGFAIIIAILTVIVAIAAFFGYQVIMDSIQKTIKTKIHSLLESDKMKEDIRKAMEEAVKKEGDKHFHEKYNKVNNISGEEHVKS